MMKNKIALLIMISAAMLFSSVSHSVGGKRPPPIELTTLNR
jgi:hypothetical protein